MVKQKTALEKAIAFVRRYRFVLIIIFILFAILSLLFYFSMMSGGFSDKSSNWGDFGSYIGGTVGTVLSALNFIILLFLSLQSREEQNHEWITTIRINKISRSFK